MRTLEELKVVKDYLVYVNTFENVREYANLSPESKIERYIYELNIDNPGIREILCDYMRKLGDEYIFGCKVTMFRSENIDMYLSEEEASEYTHKDNYTGDWYLNEDLVELEQDLWVHKECANRYAKAIDDGKYHKKYDMTLVGSGNTGSYVFSQQYLTENYVMTWDTSTWELKGNVTETNYIEYEFSNFSTRRNEIKRYIKNPEVLEEKCAKPVDDPEKWYWQCNMTYIEYSDEWVFSNDYLHEHYNRCYSCNEWFPIDNGCGEYIESEDEWFCNDCIEDNFNCTCEVCGSLIRDGEEYYREDEDGNEVVLCGRCEPEWSQEHSCEIGGYHCNHGVWKMYKLDNEPDDVIRYGTELEVEPNNRGERYNLTKAAKAAKEHMNCILSHDGSLNQDGFEIVSQPQSYEYTMSKFDDYAEAFDQIIDAGYVSHNSKHCGLHVHVTAPKDDVRDTVISRLWLIIESYKEEFKALSRRKGDFSWCQFLSDQNYGNDVKSLYKIAQVSKEAKDDTRYLVINDRNENTIEIRIFRGTLNARTFFADLQLVKNLFEQAYNVDKPITEVTFSDLIQGEYIEAYCTENNIGTSKRIEDESGKFVEMEKKILNLTKNILDITWRYIEELHVKEKEQLNKKTLAMSDNLSLESDKLADINRLIYSATTYYISLLTQYRKKNVYGVVHRINDFTGYISTSSMNKDKWEIVKKKISKIKEYNRSL